MKVVTIPKNELFDSEKNEFIEKIEETTLQLEHSLISLKKWEQKWHKPFLNKEEKTIEELLDYIRCMTLNRNVDPEVYKHIPPNVFKEIIDYIEDPMTATWFSDNSTIGAQRSSREIVTTEIIYYWMITLNIPVEFQKWHLNQLLTLIKVVSIKNAPKKKMNAREAAQQRAALNASRRAKFNSKG